MKTYTYAVSIMLAVFLTSCAKSTSESPNDNPNLTNADYGILLQGNSTLSSTLINFDGNDLKLSEKPNLFPSFHIPTVSYRNDYQYSFYKETGNCSGEILVYDFKEDIETSFSVFSDLGMCDLTILAISHSNTHVFLSYMIESAGKEKKYFIRTIDIGSENMTHEDLEISMNPVKMVVSNNRLFILTIDKEVTNEYFISVMDIGTNELIHEMDLGLEVGNIFPNPDGDIIIGYPSLHTTVNSSDLSVIYTQYGEGTEPQFSDSESIYFDSTNKMYYTMKPGTSEAIPAVYDFSNNTAILYFFENFLTSAQLNVEFEISSATTIGYDKKNNFILVGYKKQGQGNRGGLIRISPSPDFSFVDNYDLNAIPVAIFGY